MTLRDWAAQSQGCVDWNDAVHQDSAWLGIRIGMLCALPIVLGMLAVFVIVVS